MRLCVCVSVYDAHVFMFGMEHLNLYATLTIFVRAQAPHKCYIIVDGSHFHCKSVLCGSRHLSARRHEERLKWR